MSLCYCLLTWLDSESEILCHVYTHQAFIMPIKSAVGLGPGLWTTVWHDPQNLCRWPPTVHLLPKNWSVYLAYCVCRTKLTGILFRSDASFCLGLTLPAFLWTRDSRKSRKHGNHGNRDFRQRPWFCQNAVFCRVFCWNAVVLRFFLQEYVVFNQHKLKFIVWF